MPKLYMLLLGCRPQGRLTEQHDIFFGIGNELKDLLPDIKVFWPEAQGNIHLDAWREVNVVDSYSVRIVERKKALPVNSTKLFFINLGGYKQDDFEEYHYKMLAAATNKDDAIKIAKQTGFFKHTGFKGASAHVDDKYGIDIDDMYEIKDILPAGYKRQYSIVLSQTNELNKDEVHLGYLPLYRI